MPDIHQDDRRPSIKYIAGIIVVHTQLVERISQKADIGAPENLPDCSNDIPRNEQWQGHGNETDGNPDALFRHGQGNAYAQWDFD